MCRSLSADLLFEVLAAVGETSYSAFLNAAVEHAGYRSGEDEAPAF